MTKRLEDKVTIITGGTSGIGERTAEIFVDHGARVIIAGRSEKKKELPCFMKITYPGIVI